MISSGKEENLYTKLFSHSKLVIAHEKNSVTFFLVLAKLLNEIKKERYFLPLMDEILRKKNSHAETRLIAIMEIFPLIPRKYKFLSFLKVLRYSFHTDQKNRFETFQQSFPFERILTWMIPDAKKDFYKMYSTMLIAQKKQRENVKLIIHYLQNFPNDKEMCTNVILESLKLGEYEIIDQIANDVGESLENFKLSNLQKQKKEIPIKKKKSLSKGFLSLKKDKKKVKNQKIEQEMEKERRKKIDEENIVLYDIFFLIRNQGKSDFCISDSKAKKKLKKLMQKKPGKRLLGKFGTYLNQKGLIKQIEKIEKDKKEGETKSKPEKKKKNHKKKRKEVKTKKTEPLLSPKEDEVKKVKNNEEKNTKKEYKEIKNEVKSKRRGHSRNNSGIIDDNIVF